MILAFGLGQSNVNLLCVCMGMWNYLYTEFTKFYQEVSGVAVGAGLGLGLGLGFGGRSSSTYPYIHITIVNSYS